jgi:glutathione peroxidase
MIVNTASKCGLTPQYRSGSDLQRIQRSEFRDYWISANNFGSQEPGTNEIVFCQQNYGVTFGQSIRKRR